MVLRSLEPGRGPAARNLRQGTNPTSAGVGGVGGHHPPAATDHLGAGGAKAPPYQSAVFTMGSPARHHPTPRASHLMELAGSGPTAIPHSTTTGGGPLITNTNFPAANTNNTNNSNVLTGSFYSSMRGLPPGTDSATKRNLSPASRVTPGGGVPGRVTPAEAMGGGPTENTPPRQSGPKRNSNEARGAGGGAPLLGGRNAAFRRGHNPVGSINPQQSSTTASFNSSRGPGGPHPLAGGSPHRGGGGASTPGNNNVSLFSGSFGSRAGARGLIGATRAAVAAQVASANQAGGSSGGGSSGTGNSPTTRGPQIPMSAVIPSSSNINNNNSNSLSSSSQSPPPPASQGLAGGPSSSTAYDVRVMLSSGKSVTKPIELTVGAGCTQGMRPTMEDEHFCSLYSATVRDQPVSFLGILDGHCGRRVAELGSKCLPSFFLAHKALGDNNALAMVETIMQADRSIYQTLTGKTTGSSRGVNNNNFFSDSAPSGGSTLICAAVHGRMLYVACLGDARAVLLDGKTTIAMSEDHKPQNMKESKRIQRCGGFVQFGRVCGVLAVSRALGDFEFKSASSNRSGSSRGGGPNASFNRSFGYGGGPQRLAMGENPSASQQELMVSNVADVRQLALTDDTKFLILACDGLWDVVSNEEATQFVKDFLSYTPEVNDVLVLSGRRPRPTPAVIQRVLSNCSQKLAEFAVDRGSTDNVSVVLLFFHDVVETVVGFSEMPPLSPQNSLTPNSSVTLPSPHATIRKSPPRPKMKRNSAGGSETLNNNNNNYNPHYNLHNRGGGGYVLPLNTGGSSAVKQGRMNLHRGWVSGNNNGSFNPNGSFQQQRLNSVTQSTPQGMSDSFNSRNRALW